MNVAFYKSDIPSGSEEKIISAYREERVCNEQSCGAMIWFEKREYWLDGELRGIRQFDKNGMLAIETPFKDGKRNGRYYRWYEGGQILEYMIPYRNDVFHGYSMQWSDKGEFVGKCHYENGTGYDIWFCPTCEEDSCEFMVGELRYYLNGNQHGAEWWFDEDEQTIFNERHYWKGNMHGIERMWENETTLVEGYPKYYIHNEEVNQEAYISATNSDSTLPKFREQDQLAKRDIPDSIKLLIQQAKDNTI